MRIDREVLTQLIAWKNKPNRKPLVLQGARQTGKTWLLKNFGSKYYSNVSYFNFEKQVELAQFFDTTKDPSRIIENLSLAEGKAINPGSTLIIFDEIQECNSALNSLKYFCEEAPEYHVACAGSLLGVAMSKGASFPVGKVDFIRVYPLTFSEFLAASSPELSNYLEQIKGFNTIPDIFFNPLTEKLKMFYLSGGMPEAAVSLIEKRDLSLTQEVLHAILNAYTLDFSKHTNSKDVPKINYTWNSLPSQLARENRKFLYQAVKPGARAREYEDALLWLVNSGLVYRTYCCQKPHLPLSMYDDLTAFKIYMLDVGLLRRLSLLDPIAIKEGNRLFTEFKGALTENFILTGLLQQFEGLPRYWRSGNKAEVDFIVQHENNIIPIEVKSDENIRSKSLSYYRKEFNPKLSIRFSLRNLKLEDGLINIPLFMVDYTRKLVDMALGK
jgi:hypothetical protein